MTTSGNLTWQVYFINSTAFTYVVFDNNGLVISSSNILPCNSGYVQINVASTQITFTATTSYTVNANFQNLNEIQTINNGGVFTGGELDMTLTTTL